MNFIDTADVYGDGRSERLVAQLKKSRPNDKIYVTTKAVDVCRNRLPRITTGRTSRVSSIAV
jgi:aryl-alcohol dehydrogenase-like predicted oxidoreductase